MAICGGGGAYSTRGLLFTTTTTMMIIHNRSSSSFRSPDYLLLTKQSLTHNSRLLRSSAAVDGISAITTVDPAAQVQITWEIMFGALAGVTPFVVAGIEFNKRIVAQRQCKVCKGSGLVLRDHKYYFRCPSCGGFLPWQSWRRFFTG